MTTQTKTLVDVFDAIIGWDGSAMTGLIEEKGDNFTDQEMIAEIEGQAEMEKVEIFDEDIHVILEAVKGYLVAEDQNDAFTIRTNLINFVTS